MAHDKFLWVILIDTSGSMGEVFSGKESPKSFRGLIDIGKFKTKLDAAFDFSLREIQGKKHGEFLVIGYSDEANIICKGTRHDYSQFEQRIKSLHASGSTNLASAIQLARDEIVSSSAYSRIDLSIITDGLSNKGDHVAAATSYKKKFSGSKITTILIDPTPKGIRISEEVSDEVRGVFSSVGLEHAITSSSARIAEKPLTSYAARVASLNPFNYLKVAILTSTIFFIIIMIFRMPKDFSDSSFLMTVRQPDKNKTKSLPSQTEILPTQTSGKLKITFPVHMKIDEADVITAEILTKKDAILTKPSHSGMLNIQVRNKNGERHSLVSQVSLYPVMYAELHAQNFSYFGDKENNIRIITPGHPIGWIWNITALKTGEQTITINIYGLLEVNAMKATYLAKASTLNVDVQKEGFSQRFGSFLVDNLIAILSTSGPLGLILAFLAFKLNGERQKLVKRIDELENELESAQVFKSNS